MKDKITNTNSLLVGLTGSIATGKTLAASCFEKEGACVIEADKIYSNLTAPGRPLLKFIAMEFGNFIINEDSSLNRKLLADQVFDSEENRIKLNRITHPYVINKIIEKINESADKNIIIVCAPLIIESNLRDVFDFLIVVICKAEQQSDRLISRDKIRKEEAQKRIASQLSSEEKVKYADFVIDNSRSKDETNQQVMSIYQKLLKEYRTRK